MQRYVFWRENRAGDWNFLIFFVMFCFKDTTLQRYKKLPPICRREFLYETLNAGASKTYENFTPGEHKLYVKQKSGYTFYATTHTWTIEGKAGIIYTRTIED